MGLFRRKKKEEAEPQVEAQQGERVPVDEKPQEKERHKVSEKLVEAHNDLEPKSFPARPVDRTRVIAIANQKGGVGKTTTTVNLAAWLALDGNKVLVVDVDAQGNATSGLGVDPNGTEICIYDVLMSRATIDEVIQPTIVENLMLAPASFRLVGAQVELVSVMSREGRLKDILEPLRGQYHYIFIDCPPSLGLLTINALTAADELIIPVQCEYYALEGLTQLLESLEEVRKYLNPHLELAGVVMTMHDSRTKIGQEVIEEVKKHFPDKVYESIIPRNVRLSEAPSFGQPITHYDALSRGAIAYKDLAKEVMKHG